MNEPTEERRDWRISAILLVIWVVAVLLLKQARADIPYSMLAIATAFFVLLIPAMNDLVRSIERYAFGQTIEDDQDSEMS